MRTTARLGSVGLTSVLLAVGSGVITLVACGGDDDHSYASASDSGSGDDTLGDDGDATTPYTGPTQGGVLTRPVADGASGVQLPPLDGATIDTACCNITFVYDPSHYAADGGDAGDAGEAGGAAGAGPSQVYLAGDAYPLDNGAMLPMTVGPGGVWTVAACIPHDEYLRYRFYLGTVPLDPAAPDGGPTVALEVCDPDAPTVADDQGGCFNTFGPVDTCSAVDASTGSLAVDP